MKVAWLWILAGCVCAWAAGPALANPLVDLPVRAFNYYAEAEDFQGVTPAPTTGHWGRVAGDYFGWAAIQDQNTNASDAVSCTFHVPTNGIYYIWIAHLTDTNRTTTFNCQVQQEGATVTNLEYATALAGAARTDTNYVYRPGSWAAWSVRPVRLVSGEVTLKLRHSPQATTNTWVDALQVVGEAEFVPDWEPAFSKKFSYFVEAETFDGVTGEGADSWRTYNQSSASGGKVIFPFLNKSGTASHWLTVPKAGAYYLWIFHMVHTQNYPIFNCTVEQNGLTITNLEYSTVLAAPNWNNPYYFWQYGYWSAWEVLPITVPAAGAIQLKLSRSARADIYTYVDALQLVDDPGYVPDLPHWNAYYHGTNFVNQIPDFRFRVRLNSVAGPNTAGVTDWFYVSYQYAIPQQPLTLGGWSDWLSVTGAVKDAILNGYPNGSWPAVFGQYVIYPLCAATNTSLTIAWQTAQASNAFTATYSGSATVPTSFSLLQWRDSPRPMPTRIGPCSAYNKRYLRVVESLGLTTNNLPQQFILADVAYQPDQEDQASQDILGLLRRIGFNTIGSGLYPPGKSVLAQLGVTRTTGGIYWPPQIFDSDLSQTSDEVMDAWAQDNANVVRNSGWDPKDVSIFTMGDEVSWPFAFGSTGPDMTNVFHSYLTDKGFVPADFGKSAWSEVGFLGRSGATSLPAKRLFYWTTRFFPDNSADVFARWTRAMERAFYPGLPISANWNIFSTRYYTPGGAAADSARCAHDWIDFGRRRGVTCLWTEDWFGDDRARVWSYYASKLRSGANKYNDSRTEGAPPAIGFGGYVVGMTGGDKSGGALQKILGILGNGGKVIQSFVFGPEYGFPGNCWSESFKYYAELAAALRVVGKAEDLMYPGQPVRAQVAILHAQSAQVWDKKEETIATGLNAQAINTDAPDWQAEQYNLYSALQDAHVPADWVDETDLEQDTLSQFKVIYVTTPNLSSNAIAGLQTWIQAGGVAVFIAGAAQFDQYDETNTQINVTLGIAAAPRNRLYWDAYVSSLGAITSSVAGLPGFNATGLAQALTPTTAGVQARFSGSSLPAITVNTVGRGKAIVFGTLVGTAYRQGGQAAARDWVAWPVTAVAGVGLPVDFNAPNVEAATLASSNGLAVTLFNWNAVTVSNLALTVRSSQTIGAVQSVQLGTSLPFSQNGVTVSFSLPSLGPADVVKLYAATPAPTGGVIANDPYSARDDVVRLTAQCQTNPAQIALSWPPAAATLESSNVIYTLHKRLAGDTNWTQVVQLTGQTHYTDSVVTAGTRYEYYASATNGVLPAPLSGAIDPGYLCAGIEIPVQESRGKVVLVVERSLLAPLTNELTRWERDLAGDGWTVIRKATDACGIGLPGWSNALAATRALIQAEYLADSKTVKAAILFGAVPVALSGHEDPDGHGARPFPADLFYADMDGVWSDVPGWPSAPELMVGRVDFSPYGPYGLDATTLLRQYLNKDHNFRNGLLNVPRRALVKDAWLPSLASSAAGWRDFPAMVGSANVMEAEWIAASAQQAYLLGYGAGPGYIDHCSGIGSWRDIMDSDSKVVFSRLFGSRFGEFNAAPSFLNAPLLTRTCGLAALWSAANRTSGDSLWGTMALGETIGAVTKRAQARSRELAPWALRDGNTGAFIDAPNLYASLMGDPTLRLHPIATPRALTATAGAGVTLGWQGADAGVSSYHVYRADSFAGPFVLLNATPVAGTGYTDSTARSNDVVYLVRPLKLEQTASGSYWNLGQGTFIKVGLSGVANRSPGTTNQTFTLREGAVLPIALAAADADGDPLILSMLTHPLHGTVSGTGTNVTYTPEAGFSGADRFTYTVNDGQADSTPVTVSLTIKAASEPADIIPNSVPYAESFEGYPSGFPLAGTNGWSADQSDAAQVTSDATILAGLTNSYHWRYAIATNHTRVLAVRSAISNAIVGPDGTNIWTDMLVDARRSERAPAAPAEAQVGFYVNTNGHFVLWHQDWATGTNRWTELAHPPFATDAWVRVSVRIDYSVAPPARPTQHFCRFYLNGTLQTNAAGYTHNDGTGLPGGSWYALAQTNAASVTGLVFPGSGHLDDLVVSTEAPYGTGDRTSGILIIIR